MKNKKLLIILISVISVVCIAVASTIIGISCINNKNKDTAIVKFDVNIDLETNVIQQREIKKGRRVSQPKAFIKGDNPKNLNVYGWYTTKECTDSTRWDFKKGTVQGDMTLYAKWVELYDVTYYVNGEKHSSVQVFNGDKIEETAELVKGFKYLGSFADTQHTQKFDFTKPITKNTDIFVKRSPGIYLSDSVEEGLLSSGNLTDYLTAAFGTYTNGTEDGWVEEHVIESTGEKCTYVNFGFTPSIYPDGFVELSLNLDISQSQIIRITYKNLGHATKMTSYFTAMLDENTYSETGAWYNGNFCWPNWEGSGNAPIEIEHDMSEDDEWVTVDLNLYEVYKNGYSIWGTSPYLGALRIEVGYTNFGDDDWSNEMLIKSIEGLPYEIVVDDTAEVKAKMVNASDGELATAGSLLPTPAGINFVKDQGCVTSVKDNSQIFKTVDGILFHSENELALRGNAESTGFVAKVPSGRVVDLDNLTTLNVTLQNFGYAEEMIIYVYNEQGVRVKTTLEMGSKMHEPRTYVINLYGLYGLGGNFSKIEFVYNSIGVDNLILFKEVSFTEFVPYDTLGVNFNDKFCYGFVSNSNVEVTYDSDFAGILFDVKQSGAVITSPDKTYDATNEGYAYMSLKYFALTGSSISKVKVELKVNGEFKTPYVYEIDGKEGANAVQLPLVKGESGYVKAVRLTFEGTGKIILNELGYLANETSLPFYGSYEIIYNAHADWKGVANFYEYDSKEKKSTFIKGVTQPYLASSIYIGHSYMNAHLNAPHVTPNVKITGRTVVTFVYQNRTDTDKLGVHLSFDYTDTGAGDGSGLPVMQRHSLDIDSNMGDYEWSAISVVVEGADLAVYLDKYLAKVAFEFHGEQLSIRVISIDVEE